MIAPEFVDIATLPLLALVERKQFPQEACIYFCLNKREPCNISVELAT